MRIDESAEDQRLTWAEGNALVRDLGSEDHLAERIKAERTARNWSQADLARRLEQVGCAIPQTAVSKIENSQGDARRSITVDEALAFAKVFDVPYGELVLPASRSQRIEYDRLFQVALDARAAYDVAIAELASAVSKSKFLETDLEQRFEPEDESRAEALRQARYGPKARGYNVAVDVLGKLRYRRETQKRHQERRRANL